MNAVRREKVFTGAKMEGTTTVAQKGMEMGTSDCDLVRWTVDRASLAMGTAADGKDFKEAVKTKNQMGSRSLRVSEIQRA